VASTSKIVTREQLHQARARLRERGASLVQCHGCFDIVHPGHIRHLRQARALGDALLVSITGDDAIRKGDGRPLIPQELRAENLAALDFVDLVFIEPAATAEGLLREVSPDVYVKGKEYEHNGDPRFAAEREAVRAGGGRVVFSSGDVVFSSTALIAALEQSADPFHHRLTQLCGRDELAHEKLSGVLSGMRGKRVVVVGETILDSYLLCDKPGVAGESPILTLRPLEARHYDGGAAVIARHAAALGARPTLVTALPRSVQAAELRKRLEGEGIEVLAIDVEQQLPEKQRFLVGQQKVLKLDLVEPFVLDVSQQRAVLELAREACGGGAECAIIADFGLGLLSRRQLHELCSELRPLVGVLAGDVSGKRSNLLGMRGLDLACPSESELRDSVHMQGEGLPAAAWHMMERTRTQQLIVTMGPEGLMAFSPLPSARALLATGVSERRAAATEPQRSAAHDSAGDAASDAMAQARSMRELVHIEPRALAQAMGEHDYAPRLKGEHVPALTPVAIDPLGCGDALLTTATLALATGAPLLSAAFLGACAASVQVQRLGNNAVSSTDVRKALARVHGARLAYAPEARHAVG
jgi:rfaE bifunctional protein nucleotidyltransferase chain/domain